MEEVRRGYLRFGITDSDVVNFALARRIIEEVSRMGGIAYRVPTFLRRRVIELYDAGSWSVSPYGEMPRMLRRLGGGVLYNH